MAKRKSQTLPTLFGFSIFHPMNLILILNCIIYLVQVFGTEHKGADGPAVPDLNDILIFKFGLVPDLFFQGNYWQLFTYGFLHSTESIFPFHIFMNMYVFFTVGGALIPILGKTKFALLYIFSLIGGGIFILLVSALGPIIPDFPGNIIPSGSIPTIGASGAVFGMVAVFGLFFPEVEFYLLFFPIRAKNVVWISLVTGILLNLISSVSISNSCHFGGAAFGLLFYYLFLRKGGIRVTPIITPVPRTEAAIRKQQSDIQDVFLNQVNRNKEVLQKISAFPNPEEIEKYLLPLQVADANICPSTTFNPEDDFCLRCEWLVNCSLRRNKEDKAH
ncbi:MAG: rhomboid family intramembrane serine protease [Leptospira sp.]|nr:rhomboid family intramembrane serine protease [Leptospira sp.]